MSYPYLPSLTPRQNLIEATALYLADHDLIGARGYRVAAIVFDMTVGDSDGQKAMRRYLLGTSDAAERALISAARARARQIIKARARFAERRAARAAALEAADNSGGAE